MKLLLSVILSSMFFVTPATAQMKTYVSHSITRDDQRADEETPYDEPRYAFLAEREKNDIFGTKFFCSQEYGFFIGAKFTVHKPDGEKYNWSQDRAATFYKSAYEGYSKPEYYGLNGGFVYMMLDGLLFMYGGVGFLYSIQYPQYYDDTFTTWSRHYYLKDGSIEKTVMDFVAGIYCKLGYPALTIGYSKATNGLVLGVGVGF